MRIASGQTNLRFQGTNDEDWLEVPVVDCGAAAAEVTTGVAEIVAVGLEAGLLMTIAWAEVASGAFTIRISATGLDWATVGLAAGVAVWASNKAEIVGFTVGLTAGPSIETGVAVTV